MEILGTSPSLLRKSSIKDYIKLSKKDSKSSGTYLKIAKILSKQHIDDETALAIFKSYEHNFGMKYENDIRLDKFLSFLSGMDSRDSLIDSVRNIGMLSIQELEEQATKTGDWIPAIKKSFQEVRVE